MANGSGAPKVLVTRPVREAARWLVALRDAGVDALALPLIAIEPLEATDALDPVWERIAEPAALMFVSAAAAEHFFRARPRDAAALPPALRFWATGPGTARALREAGVPDDAIDAPPAQAAQFDSEQLWARVAGQVRPGVQVLIVRGSDAEGRIAGRDWLARQIEAAGGRCEAVAAYRRVAPPFGELERQRAAEAAAGNALWLFSSSEAIANLGRLMPGVDWRAAPAIATHPRIAEAARAAGFSRVRVSRPALEALVASIESFR